MLERTELRVSVIADIMFMVKEFHRITPQLDSDVLPIAVKILE